MITCCDAYPGIVGEVEAAMAAVAQRKVGHAGKDGYVNVMVHGNHLPCLFPQHGPGRKHRRLIALEDWQEEIVRAFPAAFLRGLFHSDGARVSNWATRVVAGEKRRYDYPRWQFSNRSEDILAMCGSALDLAGVAWRGSGPWTISVSRREAVARLDTLIGQKA